MFSVFSLPKVFPVPQTYKTGSEVVRSAVRGFPWNQLNLSGSRKADTVGCDGTHFTQSRDLIQFLKVLFDLQPSTSIATTAQNF